MDKLEKDFADLERRAEANLAEYARLIRALNNGICLILCLAATGIFFAVAEGQCARADRINQEQISWTK